MPSLDFFQQQEDSQKASRRTMLLLPVATLAVLLGTIILVAVSIATAMTMRDKIFPQEKDSYFHTTKFYCPETSDEEKADVETKSFGEYFSDFMTNPWFLGITGTVTLLAIGLGAWAKILELSGSDWVGDQTDAETCRILSDDDQKEKSLFNIVEEMAIAAEIPTPKVLLLEREPSINAFITQNTQNKAFLFITGGCLKRLDREELQAVVAHELSHVVNGSLKNETRMVGLLSGISIIYELGQDLFKPCKDVWILFISRAMPLMLLYLLIASCLFVFGYIGVVATRLIKKATNRHRTLLADAAAIQFTRSPALSRVLLKIAITNKKRDQCICWFNPEPISHLCFVDPFGRVKKSFFSTHPSLQKRAKAISGA